MILFVTRSSFFKKRFFGSHRKTILFLDEIHRFNRAQQVQVLFDVFGCQAINILVLGYLLTLCRARAYTGTYILPPTFSRMHNFIESNKKVDRCDY